MRTNYLGAVGLVLRFLPEMRLRKSGHIVTSSSIGVISDLPRFAAYIGSKAALEAVMRVAAVEGLADGVAFTDVHIPLVDTEMIGPTGWRGFTALNVDDVVDMIADAIVRRPAHVENPLGTIAMWMNRIVPAATRRGIHYFHRMMPDSEAAKAGSSSADRLTPGPG